MKLSDKTIVTYIILLGCVSFHSSIITAQDMKRNNKIEKVKPVFLDGDVLHLPLYSDYHYQESSHQTVSNRTLDSINNFTNHWNNSSFLIDWKETVKYPFILHFDDETFSSPVAKEMVITSRFGWRHGRPHRGIDIDLEIGDNVLSILDGKVRYVGRQRGYGKTIVVRHNNGLETVYTHLSEFSVKENEIVKKGQIIGKGGISGNARGSHLHLEVHYKGKAIHPEYLFDFSNKTTIRSEKIAVIRKWTTPRLHTSTKQSDIIVYQKPEDVIENNITIEEDRVYVVKKGDTLHRIANKHNLDVSEICKKNAIQYNDVLNIGQEIVLF